MNMPLSVVVLAAGKGTRMKSEKAKVLHGIFYAPMIQHVLDAVRVLKASKTVVVVGHQKNHVQQQLAVCNVTFAEQTVQLGTGDAVLAAEKALADESGTVMILCGDTPLIRPALLAELLRQHEDNSAQVTLVTTRLDDPTNYGRIIYDHSGNIHAIVEHKDADDKQLLVKEVNAGIYCVDKELLFATLKKVGTDNSQGEIYLTDIVKLAVEKGLTVKTVVATESIDVLGVNSRLELSQAQAVLQARRNEELMASGVSMITPETIRVSKDSTVEHDTLIEPCVHIFDNTNIGKNATIEQGAVLKNCTIEAGVVIGANSYLVNATVVSGKTVSPNTTIL